MQRILLMPETTAAAIAAAVAVLKDGGLVMYPTETVYGIAADATNADAVTRLLAYKNRPAGKAVSVLVTDQAMAEQYVELNATARNLYATFLPGPMTVISKSRGTADARLASELGTLGVRISSHPVAQALVEAFRGALTATSANASGAARPYSPDTALASLSPRQTALLDLILDAGELPRREPSTVIDTTQEVQSVLRVGELSSELLQKLESVSEADTRTIARSFVEGLAETLAEVPVVLALEGPMGAGKTHFAKGAAEALQISAPITSPTYTLIKEYPGLIHMDLWRLTEFDPAALELDRYLKPGNLIVVEWAGPALPYLQGLDTPVYYVSFDPRSETERTISFRKL